MAANTVLQERPAGILLVAIWLIATTGFDLAAQQTNQGAMAAAEPLASLPAHAGQVFAAEFSPDVKWLATGGRDGLVALRDSSKGEILKTLSGHRGLIFDVVFSPDSTLLASASADGTVKLWSL